eukprot:jgi/Mesvir1/12904/Mv05929-RA.1
MLCSKYPSLRQCHSYTLVGQANCTIKTSSPWPHRFYCEGTRLGQGGRGLSRKVRITRCSSSAVATDAMAGDLGGDNPFSWPQFGPWDAPPRLLKVGGIDQRSLKYPRDLAEPGSRFLVCDGVDIHWKVAFPPSSTESPSPAAPPPFDCLVMMHGFGASAYSWEAVMPSLAQQLRVPVVAFDRPAFGLSGRPNVVKGRRAARQAGVALPRYSPYSTEFSAEVVQRLLKELGKQRAVVVGHSAGAQPALSAAIKFRELVAAVILVAPAVRPPLQKSAAGRPFASEPGTQGDAPAANTAPNGHEGAATTDGISSGSPRLEDPPAINGSPMQPLVNGTSGAASLVPPQKPMGGASPPLAWIAACASSIRWMAGKAARVTAELGRWVTSAWRTMVAAFLRSAIMCWLIRFSINRVGTQGVKMAFYDPKRCTDEVLRGYTKPLMCMGWDNALLEFSIESKYPPKTGDPGTVTGAEGISSKLAQVDVPGAFSAANSKKCYAHLSPVFLSLLPCLGACRWSKQSWPHDAISP